eukprot:CAMPEP_0174954918 /NCGR_PEP_ID=MMETSP0004_2-20121128/695_1 /TAXON_ID=420556 /ORGANISM="Ochromonas sp., Strain CCMP1393" /LENGTH=697 /DNA_ID=CAMNT_0016202793 /DNA_START=5 /DNA_END=2094 /DNA_ORIENTATION=-
MSGGPRNKGKPVQDRKVEPSAEFIHVILLGVAIKIGGCVGPWHNGLIVGVWGYLVAIVILALGYWMLNLCVAEMCSIITFPGGHFGYVRASLGPFWGYMAGIMGLIESIFFLAVSLLKVGQAITVVFQTHRAYEWLWWVLSYLCMIGFHVRGGLTLWNFVSVCAIATLASLLIFLFGSFAVMDFNKYAFQNSPSGWPSRDNTLEFFLVLRLPGWFFKGTDLITLACEEIKDAPKVLPKALLVVMGIFTVLAIWVELAVSGQNPGLVEKFFGLPNPFPTGYGYGNIFGIGHRYGTAFSIAPEFVSCTGFMFVAGRQLNAMARSGLMPKVLRLTYGDNATPVVGMLVASVVGLIGLTFAWFYDPYTMLFRMAAEGGCIVYVLVFLSFIRFRTAYSGMERQFVSPLGIPGAVLGILVFVLVEIALLFILPVVKHGWGATIAFFGIWIVAMVYYYAHVEHHQYFSPDEQKKFMRAYIINANKRKKIRGSKYVSNRLKVISSSLSLVNFTKNSVESHSHTGDSESHSFRSLGSIGSKPSSLSAQSSGTMNISSKTRPPAGAGAQVNDPKSPALLGVDLASVQEEVGVNLDREKQQQQQSTATATVETAATTTNAADSVLQEGAFIVGAGVSVDDDDDEVAGIRNSKISQSKKTTGDDKEEEEDPSSASSRKKESPKKSAGSTINTGGNVKSMLGFSSGRVVP